MSDALLELEAKQFLDEFAASIQAWITVEVERQLSLDRCRPTWCYPSAALVAGPPPIPIPVYTVDVDALTITGIRIHTESTGGGTWDMLRSTDSGVTWASVFQTKPTVPGGSHVGGHGAILKTHLSGVECLRGHLLKLDISADGGSTGVTVQLLCEVRDGLRR